MHAHSSSSNRLETKLNLRKVICCALFPIYRPRMKLWAYWKEHFFDLMTKITSSHNSAVCSFLTSKKFWISLDKLIVKCLFVFVHNNKHVLNFFLDERFTELVGF